MYYILDFCDQCEECKMLCMEEIDDKGEFKLICEDCLKDREEIKEFKQKSLKNFKWQEISV